MVKQTDAQLDAECEALLRHVDALRKELRIKELELSRACLAYGKRRGCSLFRDFHVRNMMQMRDGEAA